jgi:glycosyltransferase involved in cell wall biosynthesis
MHHMIRLAVVTTHPIQYNAPLFARLSEMPGIELKVFYTWSQTRQGGQYDPDFGRHVEWDIPLLEGYAYCFVENTSRRPGSDHFRGIVNPTLVETLRQWSADAILVYSWPFQSHLQVLRHFRGRVPLLFRGDSTLLDRGSWLRSLARSALLTWVYRHVDMALYVGACNLEYYKAYGMEESRLHHVPHSVDNRRFLDPDGSVTSMASAMRAGLGIGDDDLVLLFVGKLEPKKDPGLLIRLARRMGSNRLRFVFAGDGPLADPLRSEAAGDGRIHFLGFQNQRAMPSIYRMADILVLPSLYNETWGLAVNEAMASGRPVIVSDRVGCAPDLVVDGSTGWAFRPGADAEARLAAILEGVLQEPARLRGMGEAASTVISRFSVDVAAQGIAAALQRVLPPRQEKMKSK